MGVRLWSSRLAVILTTRSQEWRVVAVQTPRGGGGVRRKSGNFCARMCASLRRTPLRLERTSCGERYAYPGSVSCGLDLLSGSSGHRWDPLVPLHWQCRWGTPKLGPGDPLWGVPGGPPGGAPRGGPRGPPGAPPGPPAPGAPRGPPGPPGRGPGRDPQMAPFLGQLYYILYYSGGVFGAPFGAPRGGAPRGGPPGGAKKCTFFWVFNNSPSRDSFGPPENPGGPGGPSRGPPKRGVLGAHNWPDVSATQPRGMSYSQPAEHMAVTGGNATLHRCVAFAWGLAVDYSGDGIPKHIEHQGSAAHWVPQANGVTSQCICLGVVTPLARSATFAWAPVSGDGLRRDPLRLFSAMGGTWAIAANLPRGKAVTPRRLQGCGRTVVACESMR